MAISRFSHPTLLVATLGLFSATPAFAEESSEHRQHGTHEHGHAKLDLVQEGPTVNLAFHTPAANIIGYEHRPQTNEQKQTLANAIMQLKQGESLFKFPTDAQCIQTSIDVTSELTEDEEHEDHDDHEEADEHHDDEHEAHSELTVTYAFTCGQPSALNSLHVDLFKAFPLTEAIDGQLVTDSQQMGFELSPDKPSVKF